MMVTSESCVYEIDAFDDGSCVFEFTWEGGMTVMYVRRGWYGKDGLFEVDLGSLYGPDHEIDVPYTRECTWDHVKEKARFYVHGLIISGAINKGGE